ncbi:gag protease polyprotein [Cucumis melo var. makuwa]|uniref:Gag protease polyprotein n=2 Tax=Cucumis melo TaxID=3656 RepID=A0A5A7VGL1_CUCMM|nr:gag protease polyprotein [Cucumis melo var. makuwa]
MGASIQQFDRDVTQEYICNVPKIRDPPFIFAFFSLAFTKRRSRLSLSLSFPFSTAVRHLFSVHAAARFLFFSFRRARLRLCPRRRSCPPRPPSISDLLSNSRRQPPTCALPSADAQSLSVALRRSFSVVERRRPMFVAWLEIASFSLGGSVERGTQSRGITKFQIPMLDVRYSVVTLTDYVVDWNCMSMDLEVTVTRMATEDSTRLICASFGSTRLICASFGSTRLICASLGSTRLICEFYGTTRLLCRVRARRGADRREAGRTREGHMDASGFLIASAMEMPPRRGARRGGRGGRGRGAGRVQPEVQPVAQAPDPAAPVTHADLAAMEQRFRDLIMQMREQQQPAPPAPAPAPAPAPVPAPAPASAPVPVAPQVVPDQLSAEAKHLRDFRKYNPTTFDGSLEDPTRAQLWLSSLETIFRYMKCPEDQKVQCAVFMLTDRGTAWWETTERMLGGDVRARRGADRREAGRTREGHMDASGFLIASAIDLSLVRKVGSLQHPLRSNDRRLRDVADNQQQVLDICNNKERYMKEIHYMYTIYLLYNPLVHKGSVPVEEVERDEVYHNVEEVPPMTQTQS